MTLKKVQLLKQRGKGVGDFLTEIKLKFFKTYYSLKPLLDESDNFFGFFVDKFEIDSI